ncbi:MAG: hypothetical protein KC643_24565 [Nitrospira sp.]|nr:hypothetical protein [Nitrospira sp.]
MKLLDRVKLRREKILSSFDFKRESYIRRTTAILIVPFFLFVGIAAYIVEIFFGVSGYFSCTVGAVAAIVFAVLIATKKANDKFGEE